MSEYLLLKWGSLKGWSFENDTTREAAEKYFNSGTHSLSAMNQHDTPEMKDALCDLIDAVDGEILNDWSGEQYTKEQAKKYVREYGTAAS